MKCGICGNNINNFGHNGQPLVEGRVCDSCNWKVIQERLRLAREDKISQDKPATEALDVLESEEIDGLKGLGGGKVGGVVVNGGGQVNVTTPIDDFERYAKQFEETFILGKTPIRREKAENRTKVKDGVVEGEINSIEDKQEPLDQLEPIKSATESLHGFSQIFEYLRLCKELGIKNTADALKFAEEHPGDPLQELRNHRESYLDKDWENKDLTLEDKDEIRHLKVKQVLSEV